jgi:hypothetical protein
LHSNPIHQTVRHKRKKTATAVILLQKDKKQKRINEQPTLKTTHLQTAQADTKPKFAKELFSCQRTSG